MVCMLEYTHTHTHEPYMHMQIHYTHACTHILIHT